MSTATATSAVADRYISFKGIDYEGNVARVLTHLDRHRAGSDAQAIQLIDYIDRQRASTHGVQRDDLLLLHSLVNPIRELFERHADTLALNDLDRLERECF